MIANADVISQMKQREQLFTEKTRQYAKDYRMRDNTAWLEGRGVYTACFRQTYLTLLPTFHGKNVLELIDDFHFQHVLDLGCGEDPVALQELQTLFQDKIDDFSTTGVTIPIDDGDDNRTDSNRNGVHIVRDAFRHFLRKTVLEKKRFDLIVSVQAIRYSADPIQLLKLIYLVLSDEGVALLDLCFWNQVPIVNEKGERIENSVIQEALLNRGYSVEVSTPWANDNLFRVAIKKNPNLSTLKLPIKIIPREVGNFADVAIKKNEFHKDLPYVYLWLGNEDKTK